MMINGSIDEHGMLVKPKGQTYDCEVPQLVLMPYFSQTPTTVHSADQTIDIHFRKHAKVFLSAKKLFDFPQSIATLEKFTVQEIVEEGSVQLKSISKDMPSLRDVGKSLDSPSERCMYEVRLPVLLDGESLAGETYTPGSLKVFLTLYSYDNQQEWDRLHTCLTVKK